MQMVANEEVGSFTISLDFELYWGVRHVKQLHEYEENIRNVPEVIPRLLDLFDSFEIKATWCIVGFLFFDNNNHLLANLPKILPTYCNNKFDPYAYISDNELEPRYHFAPELIRLLQAHPSQEIGTHTFSHYFCLEDGQTPEQFRSDIRKAMEVLKSWKINAVSIIFPRNQFPQQYLTICKEEGLTFYRDSEKAWYYQQSSKYDIEKTIPRLIRLLDSYINISGHNAYTVNRSTNNLINIPSSRFLRPYNPSLKFLEKLRFERISSSMTYAAKNKKGFHIWWHPHNFGTYTNENINFLVKILQHYKTLNRRFGFVNKSMQEH